MNIFKKFILLNFIFLLVSCGTAKDAFVNQKKNNTDEFLVEKKSPLVLPPSFGELPAPIENNKSKKKTKDIRMEWRSRREDRVGKENRCWPNKEEWASTLQGCHGHGRRYGHLLQRSPPGHRHENPSSCVGGVCPFKQVYEFLWAATWRDARGKKEETYSNLERANGQRAAGCQ